MWKFIDQYPLNQVPEPYRYWLAETSSITQAIKKQGYSLRLKIITAGMGAVESDDAHYLNQKTPLSAWIRHILLFADEQPWTYGKVVIPKHTLQLNEQAFTELGHQPIGDTLLYNDNKVTRSPFEIACLPHNHALLQLFKAHLPEFNSPIWSRRSTFYLAPDAPLLVQEGFFLGFNAPTSMEMTAAAQVGILPSS